MIKMTMKHNLILIMLAIFTIVVDVTDSRRLRSRSRQKSGKQVEIFQSRNSVGDPMSPQLESYTSNANDCKIEYDKVPSRHYHPMVVSRKDHKFFYPDMEGDTRILFIESKKSAIFSCPGEGNHLLLNSRDKAYIKCKKGQLYHGKNAVLWNQLGCLRKLKPTLKKTNKACGSSPASLKGLEYIVEWPIRRGLVISQIELCFNSKLESVLFTHHKVHGKYIDAKIVEPSRPSFRKESMFSVDTNMVYSKRKQKAVFAVLLHNQDHLTGKGQHYLARGHLSPDSDFVLEAEQDATYLYGNAVPQWQAINNGNWKSLENSVRDLAKERQQTLDIWTGVHGILHLPNSKNNSVKLFLGITETKKVIPVPALLWKVVHDPITRSAIAIVEINDVKGQGRGPHAANNLYTSPCEDLCESVKWVDWNVHNAKSGRTFCCSVADLQQTIPVIPDLGRVSLLV